MAATGITPTGISPTTPGTLTPNAKQRVLRTGLQAVVAFVTAVPLIEVAFNLSATESTKLAGLVSALTPIISLLHNWLGPDA